MSLPSLNDEGELPVKVHRTTIGEVLARFGSGTPQREMVTKRLVRILELARSTGKLNTFIVFGSYVTVKPEPNDVDIVLLMEDDFDWKSCDARTRLLFDHELATIEFRASIFWTRPSALVLDTVESFVESWQRKRGNGRRGIVIINP